MSTRRPTFATALLAGPLALALVACGSDDTDTSSAPSSATSANGSADDTTLLAAAKTALGEVSGATVFAIDGEASGWEVTLVAADGTESEVDVSPDGASVTRGPVSDPDDNGPGEADDLAERRQLLSDTQLDYAAAVEAARGAAPTGTVTGVDLDLEAGVATWDVQLDEDTADELTLTIDAVSGEVLRTERDD